MPRINETGYNWLVEKVEKLNKKAERLGCEPLKLVSSQVLHPVLKDTGLTCRPEDLNGRETAGFKPFYDVSILGTAPVIPGWKFRGVIEHLSEGNILKSPPGEPELDAAYRHASPTCQHCMLARQRAQTYVLRSTDDQVEMRVGRNCLADFLRSPEYAEALISWAGMIDELLGKLCSPEFSGSGGGAWYFGVKELTAFAIAYSERHGWVSGKEAYETDVRSSAAVITDYLCDPIRRRGSTPDPMRDCEMRARDGAGIATETEEVLAWVNGTLGTLPDDKISNYESNLVVLFRQGYVTSDKIALVVSAFRAYRGYKNHQERQAAANANFEHVGEEGKRGEFNVTCKKIVSLGVGEWGERFLIKFDDEKGNNLAWFTNGDHGWDEGTQSWVAATVKEHGEYNGRKQTVINRVKAIDGPTPPKKPRKKKGE